MHVRGGLLAIPIMHKPCKQGRCPYLAKADPEHQDSRIVRVLRSRQVWQVLCMSKLDSEAVQRLGPHAAHMPALMLSRDQDL